MGTYILYKSVPGAKPRTTGIRKCLCACFCCVCLIVCMCACFLLLLILLLLPFSLFTFILLLQSTIQVYANNREITFDVGYYKYEETVDGDYFLSDESSPAFISLGIRKWDTENIEKKNLKWLYTFEGTFGNVNYESPGSGTMNTNYYKASLENYLSYKFEKYEK